MELPDDVLTIVRDFSRPVTRPDWRTLRRMTSFRFHHAIATSLNRWIDPVLYDLAIRDNSPDFRYHIEFYYGYPFVTYIYARA
jgi:hypothetical protein